ncbi:MAG: hypothetical protein ABS62_05470 [Microbacterium sp. SCN 70-200]|uniref:hypothetical protein n=1 Tax=unclassified Microbacterium TaxID=2609290 RepID=UPI0008688BD9|nr:MULTISPECIES: hypothetical protein [unclassified Microbacterium]MBN9213545.1 hypothetical protein [Microbacterium sp.]ODT41638.1 MAG: hypothetical protein ABS62_05470 [Microbacterium sp. SCN 70-200]OJV85171.1 MAG: hypothetical protein BGO46_11385 [Microbacterium sp. 70-16]
MEHVVTALFAIQALAGVVLLIGWWRHGRSVAPRVLTHVALGLAGLVTWVTFTITGAVVWGWIAFAAITVGNGVGDSLMIRRFRRQRGWSGGMWSDYGGAIAAVFKGRMPAIVGFHALFAGVVYFTTLGVCIGATMEA